MTCTDMHSTNVNHYASIQKSHDQVVPASIEASEVIPCSMNISKNIPDWNKYVKDQLDTSKF